MRQPERVERMARLIDADALKEALSDLECEANNADFQSGMDFVMREFMPTVIDAQPTIESEPKRGCEFCKGRAYSSKPLTVITRTQKHVQTVFNFCPNCGRQMCAEPTESEVQDDD